MNPIKRRRDFCFRPRTAPRVLAAAALVMAALPALAAEGDSMVDKIADVMAVFVIFFVPVVGIVIFWMVHVLPEKIAHRRHHPQRSAITTLCLLSLLFGGLLWPLAWLWAFTKPVGYRAAYGTDKHEDYYDEMAGRHRSGALVREEIVHLREDLATMEAKGALPPRLKALKDELDATMADADRESSRGAQTPPEARGA